MNQNNDFFTVVAAALIILVVSLVFAGFLDFSIRRIAAFKEHKAQSQEILSSTADRDSLIFSTSDSSSIIMYQNGAPVLILRGSDGDELHISMPRYIFIDSLVIEKYCL